jgi:hypothetical protein
MKAYRGSRRMAPLILKLGARSDEVEMKSGCYIHEWLQGPPIQLYIFTTIDNKTYRDSFSLFLTPH